MRVSASPSCRQRAFQACLAHLAKKRLAIFRYCALFVTLLLSFTIHSAAAEPSRDMPIIALGVEGNLVQLRLGGDGAATRVVLDFDKPIQLIKQSKNTKGVVSSRQAVSATNGDALTIWLNFLGTQKPAALRIPNLSVGLVSQTHWTKADSRQFAIALTPLRASTIVRQFILPPSPENAFWRFVIDLAPLTDPKPAHEAALRNDANKGDANIPPTPGDLSDSARLTGLGVRSKPIVVLDPGHGGKDPGASSSAGTLEKDVVYETALALSRLLAARGYDVRLTRGRDEFRSLEQRVRFSREVGADLFLSMHADAGPRAETRGASVYTLSDRGGERAKVVKENANWSLDFETADRSKEVTGILLDLAQRETRNRSALFAAYLLQGLKEVGPVLDNSHRDAGFFVLLAPDVPAALLEMGFITNKDDEKRLRSPLGQRDIALAAADAIDQYFARLGDSARPKLQASAANLP